MTCPADQTVAIVESDSERSTDQLVHTRRSYSRKPLMTRAFAAQGATWPSRHRVRRPASKGIRQFTAHPGASSPPAKLFPIPMIQDAG